MRIGDIFVQRLYSLFKNRIDMALTFLFHLIESLTVYTSRECLTAALYFTLHPDGKVETAWDIC